MHCYEFPLVIAPLSTFIHILVTHVKKDLEIDKVSREFADLPYFISRDFPTS